MVSPAGDAAGAEKGLLEVMSGVLNYLRNRWSSVSVGKSSTWPIFSTSPGDLTCTLLLQRRKKATALGVAAL